MKTVREANKGGEVKVDSAPKGETSPEISPEISPIVKPPTAIIPPNQKMFRKFSPKIPVQFPPDWEPWPVIPRPQRSENSPKIPIPVEETDTEETMKHQTYLTAEIPEEGKKKKNFFGRKLFLVTRKISGNF